MLKQWHVVLFLVLLGILTLPNLAQDENDRDPVFEQAVYDRLSAVNPAAVSIFIEGTDAMDSGNFVLAQERYQAVLELVPDSADTLRRLSYTEISLGNFQEAIDLAQRALDLDSSGINQAAMAQALLSIEDPANYARALSLAKLAAAAEPEDDWVQSILLAAAIYNEDIPSIRQASSFLIELYPDEGAFHFYLGLAAAQQSDWILAEDELLRARELNFETAEVDRYLDMGIRDEAWKAHFIWYNFYFFGGWAGALLGLFILGWFLSRMTILASNRYIKTGKFSVGFFESIIRALYRLVIILSSAFFYISLPVVALLVIALLLGVFYLFMLIGQIPVKLVAILLVLALGTLVAVSRGIFSAFKRSAWQEPGERLQPEAAPELWQLLRDIAERVGTRPVDAIYIVPDAPIAVLERGNFWSKLLNRGQRYLILGLGALPDMTVSQLQAILAHEYGHFSNRDTAGGGMALQVRNSIMQAAQSLASVGQAHPFNPLWIFLNLFNRIFLQITLGASRLQEVLADRFAVAAYGSDNFIDGLSHVIRQTIKLNMQFNNEFKNLLAGNAVSSNLYEMPELSPENSQQFEKAYEEAINRPTNKYDSHPSFKDRVALAQNIQTEFSLELDTRLANDLLPNLPELQDKMTILIHRLMMQQRHQVAGTMPAQQSQT